MIDSETLERLLIEVARQKPQARPDTLEEATMRAQLQKECDEIVARGGSVDIPFEIPEL